MHMNFAHAQVQMGQHAAHVRLANIRRRMDQVLKFPYTHVFTLYAPTELSGAD